MSGLEPPRSKKVEDLKHQDLITFVPFIILNIANPVILFVIGFDIYLYGVRPIWIFLRLTNVLAGAVCSIAQRRQFLKRNPSLPAWFFVFYVAATHFYFLVDIGSMNSIYIHSYIQLALVVSIFPLSLRSFAIGKTLLDFIYACAYFCVAGFEFTKDFLTILLVMAQYSFIAWGVYFIIGKIREQYYVLVLEREAELQNAKQVVSAQLEKLDLFSDTLQTRNSQIEALRGLSLMAAQASHDIRSPLSVLNSVVFKLTDEQAEYKQLVEKVVSRINGIANGLLQEYRSTSVGLESADPLETVKIGDLLKEIIKEKRFEYERDARISISLDLQKNADGWVSLNSLKFKAIISNIINNSVESSQKETRIEVLLSSKNSRARIEIQDNGPGIPAHILRQLGKNRVSHGKAGISGTGSGLGLFSAARTIEKWGGKIDFLSRNSGALICIEIPLAPNQNA